MGNITDTYVEMTYLRVCLRLDGTTSAGGSGQRRIWLSEVPKWLVDNPGAMIVSMCPM